MNLIPTLISLGLAASVSVFYLQNQSDEPNKINYRAALSDFEKTALEFAAHTPLQNRSTLMTTDHCDNLNRDFVKKLPTGSGWDLNIGGLDCDIAELKVVTSAEDFPALLSAAGASGRNYATETTPATATEPLKKNLKWTQRLYSRNASDLGIKAKLKNNKTGTCLSCSSDMRHGKWSHESDPNVRWIGCPAPGELACDPIKETRTCTGPLNGGMECPRIDKSWTSPSNRDEKRNCLGVPSCREAIYTPCPTNICLESQKPPPKSITCPESGSPCKLNVGRKDERIVESGYIKNCSTPRCGAWEKEDKCATMHCLNIGENDPEKPKCVGKSNQGCINDQGILVRAGTTEMCQLPACTELTIDVACRSECKAGDGYSYEEYTCNGARCKNATSKLWKNEKGRRQCPPRPCSKLTDWAWDPPGSEKKTCLNKGDTQPEKTRTCEKYNAQPYDNFGCRDTKGVYFTPGEHVEKTVTLPGCPYWGPWYPKGQCTLDKKKLEGIQKETRRCLRHNSKGKDPYEEENVCVDKVGGLATQEKTCDYPWGKWDRTEKSCPRCVETTNDSDYGTCDGGENQKSCILGTTIFESDIVAKCSHAVPKCGKWREWSACEFEDNDGYGSCTNKDGIKTRECSSKICAPNEGYQTLKTAEGESYNVVECHTPKCEVKIDTMSSDNVINKKTIHDGINRDVRIIFKETAVLSATSFQRCALKIEGNFRSMILKNHGVIIGYNGKGGDGGNFDLNLLSNKNFDVATLNGSNGKDGGNALCITNEIKNLKIENHGVIKGGRAGGGGGSAACYIIRGFNNKVIEKGCLAGGAGGHGNNSYNPHFVDGKNYKKISNDSFVLESGQGGNGGYLFPDSRTFYLNQSNANDGYNGFYIKLNDYKDIEVFQGKGGKPGNNGEVCRLDNSHSRHHCSNLIN